MGMDVLSACGHLVSACINNDAASSSVLPETVARDVQDFQGNGTCLRMGFDPNAWKDEGLAPHSPLSTGAASLREHPAGADPVSYARAGEAKQESSGPHHKNHPPSIG